MELLSISRRAETSVSTGQTSALLGTGTFNHHTPLELRDINTKFKYSRLNLNVHADLDNTTSSDPINDTTKDELLINCNSNKSKESSSSSSSSSLIREPRSVSLRSHEILSLILFYFQIHGLLYLLDYDLSPSDWHDWWCFTLLFNLDFPSFIIQRGTTASRYAHTIIIPLLLCFMYISYRVILKKRYENNEKRTLEFSSFKRAALIVCEFMYIPVLITTYRAAACNSIDNTAAYLDNDVKCWSVGHVIPLALNLLCVPLYLFAFPHYLYTHTRSLIVFESSRSHEGFVKSRELEYLMGVNNRYNMQDFFVIASYTRRAAHYRFCVCVMKIALVSILFLLGTYYSPHPQLSNLLFLITLIVCALHNFFIRVYRISITNTLSHLLLLSLLLTCMFGVLLSSGLRNGFLIGITLTRLLLALNLICILLCICVAVFHYYVYEKKYRVPVWPVCERSISSLLIYHPQVITAINTAKALLEDALVLPDEFYPVPQLVETISHIRQLLVEGNENRKKRKVRDNIHNIYANNNNNNANSPSNNKMMLYEAKSSLMRNKSRTSTTASLVLFGENQVVDERRVREHQDILAAFRRSSDELVSILLLWTLQDLCEELSLLYNSLQSRSTSSLEDPQSLARFQRMSESINGLADSLDDKNRARMLWKPAHQKFIMKLMFIRALLGPDCFRNNQAIFTGKYRSIQHHNHGDDDDDEEEAEEGGSTKRKQKNRRQLSHNDQHQANVDDDDEAHEENESDALV